MISFFVCHTKAESLILYQRGAIVGLPHLVYQGNAEFKNWLVIGLATLSHKNLLATERTAAMSSILRLSSPYFSD